MCGIAGVVDYSSRYTKRATTEKMLSTITYRGPNECGIYSSPHASLGNVRLSIIDLAGGQQPLCDETKRYWIVLNGEIFNYLELREDLKSKGRKFQTNSDTEVLVQLYAEYGKECLKMLNGQFAMAIWDKKKEELFLARDRVGIRPLFYNFSDGVLSFGSEIKTLFSQDRIKREFKYESLEQVYTFWTALTPNTAFKDIYELSPAHYMVFNHEGIKVERYWRLSFGQTNNNITFNEAKEQFDELFTNAVRLRLRADVEVAAYLSGGIDSSATVAYIKDVEPGVLNTFSVGFSEKNFDEGDYQNDAVKYFGTTHQSFICQPEAIAEAFPKVVWHCETPLTRTGPVPMYMLSRLVRENNIKVVVTGEGSDEILAGYNIFKETKIRNFWSSQPNSQIRPMLLQKLYAYLPQMKQFNPKMLKLFYGYKLEDTSNPFYSHLLRWNNSNHIKKHLDGAIRKEMDNYEPFSELLGNLPDGFDNWDSLAKAQWLETTIFMSGYLLSSQGDRMAMANSVEGRYPFLDYRVIEFCSSLPSRYKLNCLNEKFLLKKLLTNKIPDSILKRTKQAYRAPIQSVFLSDKTPDSIREMLTAKACEDAGVFDYHSLENLFAKISKVGFATEMENMVLASVVSTNILYYQFVANKPETFNNGLLPKMKYIEDN